MIKKTIYLSFLLSVALASVQGQYAPAAKEEGSTAIHKDSSIFVEWAANCTVERGYVKISDTTFTYEENNKANNGNDSNALAKADGKVVSLGDKGIAILSFESPIINGEGPDFAVFENSFRAQEPPQNYFLELAFVEVSSDSQRFVRFPSISETPASPQIETFGQLDPTKIHNLAGKYAVNYGVPFDLEELRDSSGIDLQNITHIRIIDVIGSVNPNYASYDSQGNIINDPFPTPFAAGGFDLDAVGAIHSKGQTSTINKEISTELDIYPNPIKIGQNLNLELKSNFASGKQISLRFYDITGKMVHQTTAYNQGFISLNISLKQGIYFVEIPEMSLVKKIIVTK